MGRKSWSLILALTFASTLGFVGCNNSKVFKKTAKLNEDSSPQFRSRSGYGSWDSYSNNGQRQRGLILPKGSKITLTPHLMVPISSSDDTGIGSSFEASLPISFTLNDLSWTSFGSELFGGWSHRKHFQERYGLSSSTDVSESTLHSRNARDLSSFLREQKFSNSLNVTRLRESKCHARNLVDRRIVLQKLETALASGFGFLVGNGKDCLLRTACEIHEYTDIHSAFGLVGEIVKSIFSVDQLSRDCGESRVINQLSPYIKAERAGKVGKCVIYKKRCSKSIFTDL